MGAAAQTASLIETKRDLMLLADELAGVARESRSAAWLDTITLPHDTLTGEPIRIWLTPQGGFVVWSAAAEESAIGSGRVEVVWQHDTETLPPALLPFADDWAE